MLRTLPVGRFTLLALSILALPGAAAQDSTARASCDAFDAGLPSDVRRVLDAAWPPLNAHCDKLSVQLHAQLFPGAGPAHAVWPLRWRSADDEASDSLHLPDGVLSGGRWYPARDLGRESVAGLVGPTVMRAGYALVVERSTSPMQANAFAVLRATADPPKLAEVFFRFHGDDEPADSADPHDGRPSTWTFRDDASVERRRDGELTEVCRWVDPPGEYLCDRTLTQVSPPRQSDAAQIAQFAVVIVLFVGALVFLRRYPQFASEKRGKAVASRLGLNWGGRPGGGKAPWLDAAASAISLSLIEVRWLAAGTGKDGAFQLAELGRAPRHRPPLNLGPYRPRWTGQTVVVYPGAAAKLPDFVILPKEEFRTRPELGEAHAITADETFTRYYRVHSPANDLPQRMPPAVAVALAEMPDFFVQNVAGDLLVFRRGRIEQSDSISALMGAAAGIRGAFRG